MFLSDRLVFSWICSLRIPWVAADVFAQAQARAGRNSVLTGYTVGARLLFLAKLVYTELSCSPNHSLIYL